MSDGFAIFVPGSPVAWSRTSRGMGARTSGKYASFTPPKQRAAAAAIGWRYRHGNGRLFDGPVHLHVVANYPRPKSHKGKNMPHWKTSKPDIDNIIKLAADSLNKIAWNDDAQVVCASGMKIYSDVPGLAIEIEPLA